MLPSGTIILNGKYRIEELIGKGAFAEVYRATHLELNIARAIKVLRIDAPGIGSTTFNDYRERYRQEFQIAARLDHPNVIKVYDFIEEQGMMYAVLEYAPGGSVKDLLAKYNALPIERAIQILLDCAAGLEVLHEKQGVIHRDIKPSNILLDAEGRAKIADLGLAQVGGGQSSMRSELGSAAGIHPGTALYRSPEHNTWEPLTPTSDVYSLGCVAFEILAGQVWKMVRHKVAHIRDVCPMVPEWLDQIVARMLCETPGIFVADANDPQKRFVTMEAVAKKLVSASSTQVAPSAALSPGNAKKDYQANELKQLTESATTNSGIELVPSNSSTLTHVLIDGKATTQNVPIKLRYSKQTKQVSNVWELVQVMVTNQQEAANQLYSGNLTVWLREVLAPEAIAFATRIQQEESNRVQGSARFLDRFVPLLLADGIEQARYAVGQRSWVNSAFLTEAILKLAPDAIEASQLRLETRIGALEDMRKSWQSGDVTSAKKFAEQALSIEPDDEEAKTMLQKSTRVVDLALTIQLLLDKDSPEKTWKYLEEILSLCAQWSALVTTRDKVYSAWIEKYRRIQAHNRSAKLRSLAWQYWPFGLIVMMVICMLGGFITEMIGLFQQQWLFPLMAVGCSMALFPFGIFGLVGLLRPHIKWEAAGLLNPLDEIPAPPNPDAWRR